MSAWCSFPSWSHMVSFKSFFFFFNSSNSFSQISFFFDYWLLCNKLPPKLSGSKQPFFTLALVFWWCIHSVGCFMLLVSHVVTEGWQLCLESFVSLSELDWQDVFILTCLETQVACLGCLGSNVMTSLSHFLTSISSFSPSSLLCLPPSPWPLHRASLGFLIACWSQGIQMSYSNAGFP